VIAEVCKLSGIQDKKTTEQQAEMIQHYFENEWFIRVNVDNWIAEEAAALVRNDSNKLKPHDAIHIITALKSGATELHTYDDVSMTPLDKIIGDPPLPILHPPKLQRQAKLEEAIP
jgi:predicted nucleic acid-binding protein